MNLMNVSNQVRQKKEGDGQIVCTHAIKSNQNKASTN